MYNTVPIAGFNLINVVEVYSYRSRGYHAQKLNRDSDLFR